MKSSIQKLQKIFKLEAERGYDDRSVVGGFARMLDPWEADARADELPEELIQAILIRLRDYHHLSPTSRQEALQGLWRRIHGKENPLPEVPLKTKKEFESRPVEILPQQRDKEEPAQTADYKDKEPANIPFVATKIEENTHPAQNIPIDQGQAAQLVEALAALNAPVTVLTGIGLKYAQTLGRLGLKTLGDILYFYPRRYDDYSLLKPINRLKYGEQLTVIGTVQSVSTRPVRGGRANLTEAVVSDGSGALRVTWFNPYVAKRLRTGMYVVLSGKIDQYLGRLVMNNPEFEPLEQQNLSTNRIVPVYPLTANITQRWLRRIVHQVVSYWAPRVGDPLPRQVTHSAGLIDLSTALSQTHYPDSWEQLEAARFRLAFEEIFLLQLGLLRQKRTWQERPGRIFETSEEWMDTQVRLLPFTLTRAQQNVLVDVRTDLMKGHPMNRLLQGDVGSGKTVVAALAISIVVRQGAQAALMVPTSILAEQHYRSLLKLLAEKRFTVVEQRATEESTEIPQEVMLAEYDAALRPDEIRLMVGSTPEAEKIAIREGLVSGQIKVVIGTHALLEDPVTFADLQLVIVDEQHRFGVDQRAILRSKGDNPHLLVMTATPIPRSLALTVFGDLDLSIMDEMPPGRQGVDTHVLVPRLRERAYAFIRRELTEGRQAFIIYPLVDEPGQNGGVAENQHISDSTLPGEVISTVTQIGDSTNQRAGDSNKRRNAELVSKRGIEINLSGYASEAGQSAVEEFERLRKEIFPEFKVGLLHGRLRPDEKDLVMERFRNGEYQLLVSTTVVEVGVDIPNATVMLVEGANRFGLAQLHQLRGRVGRGQNKAYCLLIPEKEDAVENERLTAMVETNDGFVLAERDLEQRGPGDFMGTRQSGLVELRLASLTDVRLIEKARRSAQQVFGEDPDLERPENRLLSKAVQRFWGEGGDIS
jgi:ATP-dependent DNA helicase RecG